MDTFEEYEHELPGDIMLRWKTECGLSGQRDRSFFAQKLGISSDTLKRIEAVTRHSDPADWEKKGGMDNRQVDTIAIYCEGESDLPWLNDLREAIKYQEDYAKWYELQTSYQRDLTIINDNNELNGFKQTKSALILYSKLLRNKGCLIIILLTVFFLWSPLLFRIPIRLPSWANLICSDGYIIICAIIAVALVANYHGLIMTISLMLWPVLKKEPGLRAALTIFTMIVCIFSFMLTWINILLYVTRWYKLAS